MTVFSVRNAVLVKRFHVPVVLLTREPLASVAKRSLVVETLASFPAKQFVNKGTQDRAKSAVCHQKFSNKLPWVCNNNKTFPRDNSLLNKVCHLIKWGSFHRKVCRLSKACRQTKWVNFHLNKACHRIRGVKSHKPISNQPTL